MSHAPKKTKTTPEIPRPMPKKQAKQATPARFRRSAKNKMMMAMTKAKRN